MNVYLVLIRYGLVALAGCYGGYVACGYFVVDPLRLEAQKAKAAAIEEREVFLREVADERKSSEERSAALGVQAEANRAAQARRVDELRAANVRLFNDLAAARRDNGQRLPPASTTAGGTDGTTEDAGVLLRGLSELATQCAADADAYTDQIRGLESYVSGNSKDH